MRYFKVRIAPTGEDMFKPRIAVFSLICLLVVGLVAQTRINEDQIKYKIRAVEWSRCKSTGGQPDCTGLEYFRFVLADGTIHGPFIAVPAPPGFVPDSKWITQAEFK